MCSQSRILINFIVICFSVSLEDIVDFESCVHLLSPEGDNSLGCTIYIKFSEPSDTSIYKVVVVSEVSNEYVLGLYVSFGVGCIYLNVLCVFMKKLFYKYSPCMMYYKIYI